MPIILAMKVHRFFYRFDHLVTLHRQYQRMVPLLSTGPNGNFHHLRIDPPVALLHISQQLQSLRHGTLVPTHLSCGSRVAHCGAKSRKGDGGRCSMGIIDGEISWTSRWKGRQIGE